MSNQATDAEMNELVSVAQHERSPVASDEAIPSEAPSAPHPPPAPAGTAETVETAETVPPNHHHEKYQHENEPSSSPSPSSDDELEEIQGR